MDSNLQLIHFNDYRLVDFLSAHDITAKIVSSESDLESINLDIFNLILIETSNMSEIELRHSISKCNQIQLPQIVLVSEKNVSILNENLKFTDFVVTPFRKNEVLIRARRAIRQSRHLSDNNIIRHGDLAINPTNYEVLLKGKRVNLRFKEYEILLLLASNPRRVYSRETLLSKIWGYDYFRGTRTVDVHIRRLRSKIEDDKHSFIETIWNVGYRFKS